MAAAAKRMILGGFDVTVHMTDSGGFGVTFESEIRLAEDYTIREQRILFNAARRREVHHLLRGPIQFRETLAVTRRPA